MLHWRTCHAMSCDLSLVDSLIALRMYIYLIEDWRYREGDHHCMIGAQNPSPLRAIQLLFGSSKSVARVSESVPWLSYAINTLARIKGKGVMHSGVISLSHPSLRRWATATIGYRGGMTYDIILTSHFKTKGITKQSITCTAVDRTTSEKRRQQ
jgi:hypothetical protein